MLEQSDGGVAELYLVSFEAATNLMALINDNDFNMDWIEDHDEPQRKNCLWVIQFHNPLLATP